MNVPLSKDEADKVRERYLEKSKNTEGLSHDEKLEISGGNLLALIFRLGSKDDKIEAQQKIWKGYDDEDAVQAARDARDDEVWRKEQQGQDTDKKGYRGAIVVLLLFMVCVGAIAVRHFEALSVKGRFGAIIAVIFLVYVVYIAIKDSKN